jgi:hypothetical protein
MKRRERIERITALAKCNPSPRSIRSIPLSLYPLSVQSAPFNPLSHPLSPHPFNPLSNPLSASAQSTLQSAVSVRSIRSPIRCQLPFNPLSNPLSAPHADRVQNPHILSHIPAQFALFSLTAYPISHFGS